MLTRGETTALAHSTRTVYLGAWPDCTWTNMYSTHMKLLEAGCMRNIPRNRTFRKPIKIIVFTPMVMLIATTWATITMRTLFVGSQTQRNATKKARTNT